MDNKRNSAQRVLEIIEQALLKSGEIPTAHVWAEVFGLDSERAVGEPHEVWEKLSLLRIEIDAIPALMAQTTIPEKLYLPHLERLKSVVSVPNISASWKNYRGNIQPDTIVTISFCANLIPSEPLVSKDELQSVLDLVLQLKAEIEALPFSPSAREFFFRQLNIIEVGIRDYPISGINSIRAAINKGFSDMPPNAGSPGHEEAEDKVWYSKVGEAWRAFHSAAKGFIDTDKFLTAVVTRLEQGSLLLENGLALLP